MNKVISGYFDNAHRGLQRQQQGERAPSGAAVQLPPLRSDEEKMTIESSKAHSRSLGSLVEYTADQARAGVQSDKYQQVLHDNAQLMKKVRQMQEQLAITSAKKEAFKAQAARLEKEFKKGRDQSEALQKDLIEARFWVAGGSLMDWFRNRTVPLKVGFLGGECVASRLKQQLRRGIRCHIFAVCFSTEAMLGALKSVFWPQAARNVDAPAPALENLAGDRRKPKLRDVKAEDALVYLSPSNLVGNFRQQKLSLCCWIGSFRGEDYPTPEKYLEGAEIPTFYQFQSNMVADEDLKPGMCSGLEVDKRLTLPTRTHIRFLVTGQEGIDVIHSFSIPSLGLKTDATPGRINRINTFIQREGVFYGQCSELCGTLHGFMPIVVEAVSPETYAAHARKWYKEHGSRAASFAISLDHCRNRIARRESSQLSKESQEAMQMMTEMRKAHIQEVRLLQKGLQARGSGEMRPDATADIAPPLLQLAAMDSPTEYPKEEVHGVKMTWRQAGIVLFTFAAPSAVMAVPFAIANAGFIGGIVICMVITGASIAGSNL
eukprot:s843_g6.t2